MLHYIKHIEKIEGYKITCLFNTNEIKTIDFDPIVSKYRKINDGLVSKLTDLDYFKSVSLDSYGTVCWSNGVDFCPEVLYNLAI
jgi:hypothetical protein